MSVLTVLSLAGNIEIYVDDQQLATFVIPKGGLNFVNPQGIGILTLYGNGVLQVPGLAKAGGGRVHVDADGYLSVV
jgi:hypothetical protein